MSIIREDEGNMDAAIWHMERAYEVQPFNPAVQDELRRLYGRRDGVEPPKIRLTRGALVRMYGRGELYQQAIAEIQAGLAEEPNRLDLQILLARMCYLSGQRVEATEACSALLGKLPFCYEANYILAEVLPGTSRAEDAKIFQQRVFSLDPYQAFLSPTITSLDQIPDQAVMVEEFVLSGDTDLAVQAPDWTRTAGVSWEDTPEEELPSWLNSLNPTPPTTQLEARDTSTQAQVPGSTGSLSTVQPPAAQESEEEVIPDWMKAVGWSVSDGKEMETHLVYEESEPEDATPAEIPSWLQQIAPSEEASEPKNEEQERLGWLESILPGDKEAESGDLSANSDLFQGQKETAQLPEDSGWLADLSAKSTSPEASSEPVEAETPEWLAGLAVGAAGVAAATSDEEDMPDWMKSIGPDAPGAETGAGLPEWLVPEVEADQTLQPEQPQGTSDFTEIPSIDETGQPTVSPVTPSTGTTEYLVKKEQQEKAAELAEGAADSPDMLNMNAAIAWLKSLAARQGADEATLTTPIEERTSTPPDWLQQEAMQEQTLSQVDPIAPLDASNQLTESLSSTDSIPLDTRIEGQVEESVLGSENTDWMQSDGQGIPETVETVPEVPVMETPMTEEKAGPGQPDLSDMDSAMAWLKSLAARQGADEATLITPPDQRTETPPEWLTDEISAQVSEPAQAGDHPFEEPASAGTENVDQLQETVQTNESSEEQFPVHETPVVDFRRSLI